jgi:hypothetical protein
MRDVYEVLKEKELQLERLKQDIEDLRLAAAMSAHGNDLQNFHREAWQMISVKIDQRDSAARCAGVPKTRLKPAA